MNNLEDHILDQIGLCDKCLEKSYNYKDINGIKRFQRYVQSTKSTLEKHLDILKVNDSNEIIKNLNKNVVIHYWAIIQCLEIFDVTAIYRSIKLRSNHTLTCDSIMKKKQYVHLVNEKESIWINVVAKDPIHYHDALITGTTEKNEMEKILNFIVNIENFSRTNRPTIIFYMWKGCSKSVKTTLENLKITVITPKLFEDPPQIDCDLLSSNSLYQNTPSYSMNNPYINSRDIFLDITAMMALISESTHIKSTNHITFHTKVLYNQFIQQQNINTKDFILSKIQGKQCFTSKMAWNSFYEIVKYVGGYKECSRCELLSKQLTILDDIIDDSINLLNDSKNVNKRSKIIFGTASKNSLTIITSNKSFINACLKNGIFLSVIFHNAVALSEKKIILPQNHSIIDHDDDNDESIKANLT